MTSHLQGIHVGLLTQSREDLTPPGIELLSYTCNNFLLFIEFAKLLAMQMEMTTAKVHYLKEPEG